MSKGNEVKAAVVSSGIVDDPHDKAGHRGFQSREAMKQSVAARTAPVEEGAEPIQGEVADFTDQPSRPINEEVLAADAKMVKVRSREFVAPFFYGKKQYSLPAGKDVLVPLAVKRHLEEKGKL